MGFSTKIREEVLVASARRCAICHKFCGSKIELHHIKQKAYGGEDTFDNCIPLCFDCHSEVGSYNPNHPKGSKYTEQELKSHRDNWYESVRNKDYLKESNENLNQIESYNELDKDLYIEIKNLFTSNKSIDFIRINNFAGFSFDTRKLDSFYEFEHYCNTNPEYEFINTDLEEIKEKLHNSISKFTSIIATETWPTHQSSYNTVPPEWEWEQPRRFEEVVRKIHSYTKEITDSYDNLIRLGRRIFGKI